MRIASHVVLFAGSLALIACGSDTTANNPGPDMESSIQCPTAIAVSCETLVTDGQQHVVMHTCTEVDAASSPAGMSAAAGLKTSCLSEAKMNNATNTTTLGTGCNPSHSSFGCRSGMEGIQCTTGWYYTDDPRDPAGLENGCALTEGDEVVPN